VKLPLYWKMMLGFGLIIAMLMAVNAFVLVQLTTVRNTVRAVVTTDVRALDLTRQLRAALADEEDAAQKYLISRDAVYATLYLETGEHVEEVLDSLLALQPEPSARRALRRLRTGREVLHAAIVAGMTHGAEAMVADSMDAFQGILDDHLRRSQNAAAASIVAVEEVTVNSLGVAITLGAASLLASLAAAFVLTRSITRPLGILERGTQQVARGMYEPIPVAGGDEIGRLAEAFNTMSGQLKRINDLKSEMMHHISHELRVPLQSLHAAYYVLHEELRGPLNDEQQKLLTMMRENVDRITEFSNQFLDLAKIEAGMMEFHRTPVDLRAVAGSVVEALRLLAERKKIRVTLDAAEIPPVLADAEKMRTVITNLLSNAIKFTPTEGNVTIALSSSAHTVRLAVRDTGVGIDPADLRRIFTKFYRAHNTAAAGARGTGVGLALVKAIIDGHRGRVSVESTVNEGSTFTVELPLGGSPGGIRT
jgi:two-component system sensor histidine kinase GlrK